MRGDDLNARVLRQQNGKINISFNKQPKIIHSLNNQRQIKSLKLLQEIEAIFSSYIGDLEIKHIVTEIYAMKQINEKRTEMGLSKSKQVLHMIFTGNPGTGKTSIARELAKLLYRLNILSQGQFIEVERADLVGEYIGQTAQKTKAIFEKAIGGVLFIDEAYSLARGGHKDFGREAIDTIVKQMEDHSQDLVLILAGYPKEMDHFMSFNPGIASRFPFQLYFQDYSTEDLIKIAHQMAENREYILSNCAIEKLYRKIYHHRLENMHNFSNGRYVRNIIEQGIRKQAIRLFEEENLTITDLQLITSEDIVDS